MPERGDDEQNFSAGRRPVPFEDGQSVLAAARKAGHYIPHLCWDEHFPPHGSCKLCVVKIGDRHVSACATLAREGLEAESEIAEILDKRRELLTMLFAEGNHFCPSCEKSGNCQLQALAYDLEFLAPMHNRFFPDRPVDASHPDILLDFNRCIFCELCMRASRDVDGKDIFSLSGRGINKHLVVNAESGRFADTDSSRTISRPTFARWASSCTSAEASRFRSAKGSTTRRRSASSISRQRGEERMTSKPKLRIATTSLAGCFGCHTSFLDIDERLLDLVELVEFDRSPLTDIKHCGPCDIGLVEGGVCNAENVHVLREFRDNCKILVAIGACAINGGLPAQRNHLDLQEILIEVYQTASRWTASAPKSLTTPNCRCCSTKCVRSARSCRWIIFSMAARPRATRFGNSSPTSSRAGRRAFPIPTSFRLRRRHGFRFGNRRASPKSARIAIDPISRVEGHGKITLLLDDDGHVHQARLHIVEFRGFEKFVQGRPYWEAPVMVQRLCGICPVSHQIAAAKALDHVVARRRRQARKKCAV